MDGCGDRGKEGAPGLSCLSPVPPFMSPVCRRTSVMGKSCRLATLISSLQGARGALGMEGIPGEPMLDQEDKEEEEEEEEEEEKASFTLKLVLVEIAGPCPAQTICPLPWRAGGGCPGLAGTKGCQEPLLCLVLRWQSLPGPQPDAAGSGNVISLPLISRARLCAPCSAPASPAFIDSPLIQLEGEVGSNKINDGVRALLTAACDGRLMDRDPRPVLAIPAPSIGDGDELGSSLRGTAPQHPPISLPKSQQPRPGKPSAPRRLPTSQMLSWLRRPSNQAGRPLQIGCGHGQRRSGPCWVLLRACARPRLVSAANEGSEHPSSPRRGVRRRPRALPHRCLINTISIIVPCATAFHYHLNQAPPASKPG